MPVTKNVARQFPPEYSVSWRSQPWAAIPNDHGTDAGPRIHLAGERRHRGRLGLVPAVELHEAEGGRQECAALVE
jgi:hypothetical protein